MSTLGLPSMRTPPVHRLGAVEATGGPTGGVCGASGGQPWGVVAGAMPTTVCCP
jgi:hypothetical protein